jgi:beta-galactosidase
VPFEYVTGDELENGLAGRYPCIYAPHIRAISEEHIKVLTDYVKSGGRLIADVQFAFCDPWSKMHPKGTGTQTEKLFGAWVDMIHDTRTNPKKIGIISVEGLYGDIKTTNARVLSTFADGTPAITEHRLGRGSAVLMGFDAARMCHLKDAAPEVEALMTDLIATGEKQNWRSTTPMSYCLRTEQADHYFLLNDGPERPAFIEVYDASYRRGNDVITGDPVVVDGTISVTIPQKSAMWLRFEKVSN